jgi:general secretion pathway protein D
LFSKRRRPKFRRRPPITPPQVPSKTTDHAAKADAPHKQILIEATIVEVTLKECFESGVNLKLLNDKANGAQSARDDAAQAATIVHAASVTTTDGLVTDPSSKKTSDVKFVGAIRGNAGGAIRALESMGEAKVLAAPRLLVADEQDADVQLGHQLGYQEEASTMKGISIKLPKFVLIGTELQVRPYLATNGTIRLDASMECSTGYLDADGIPYVNSFRASTDVTMPNGGTIAVGSKVYAEEEERPTALAYLSWLPYLGWLSFVTEDVVVNRQLVVLVTPQVYEPPSSPPVASPTPSFHTATSASRGLATPSKM